MATTQDYTGLITSAWQGKPKFTAMVTSDVSVQVQVQNLMLAMSDTLFDLDLAVGDQLDIIGQWVGFSREVEVPITGVFFTWNDTTPLTGWSYGIWRGQFNQTEITSLPDDVYRNMIKAKIAANHWDGTTPGLYAVWAIAFPLIIILIQDHGDMSYDIGFFGAIIDSLTLALLTGQYLPLKPEGVRINEFFVAVDTGPLFGWNMNTDYVQGWGTGEWAREIRPS